jgi:hypothetical protein
MFSRRLFSKTIKRFSHRLNPSRFGRFGEASEKMTIRRR